MDAGLGGGQETGKVADRASGLTGAGATGRAGWRAGVDVMRQAVQTQNAQYAQVETRHRYITITEPASSRRKNASKCSAMLQCARCVCMKRAELAAESRRAERWHQPCLHLPSCAFCSLLG